MRGNPRTRASITRDEQVVSEIEEWLAAMATLVLWITAAWLFLS